MENLEALARIIENYESLFSNLLDHERDSLERLWVTNDQSCLKAGSAVPRQSTAAHRNVMVRWQCSTWCNYDCSYCFQEDHRRRKEAHCFDVFPASKWVEAFHRHFDGKGRNVSLVISGGEPTLDAKNMAVLLDELCGSEYLLSLRIDTNASWSVGAYERIRHKEKIWLNCSFHPPRARIDPFVHQIEGYRRAGYNIGMVTLVLSDESRPLFEQLRARLPPEIPINVNPDVDPRVRYNPESVALLAACLPQIDYEHKFEKRNPYGRECLHPAVAYQMAPNGTISVACHEWMTRANFVTDSELPTLFATYATCPKSRCDCSDMYSFQRGCLRNLSLNPLGDYKDQLLKRYPAGEWGKGLPTASVQREYAP